MSEHVIRRSNLLALYAAFVAEAQRIDPAVAVFGLDRAFAAKLQIANTSFSTYKGGGRPIGARIARQIESLMSLPMGWMDQEHASEALAHDDVQLNRFLKLAARAYGRADAAGKKKLAEMMRKSLAGE